jgi:hypothetical protein
MDSATLAILARAWTVSTKYEVERCYAGLDKVWPEDTGRRAILEQLLAECDDIRIGQRQLDQVLPKLVST